MFDDLDTIDEVRSYVTEGCRSIQNSAQSRALPPTLAEPSQLIAHAVKLAGPDGVTPRDLRSIFGALGTKRFEQGLRRACESGLVARRKDEVGRVTRAYQVPCRVSVLYYTGD